MKFIYFQPWIISN